MQNKMFRSSLQQDSQEFLRCLLMQIHDETAVEVPSWSGGVASRSRDTPPGNARRDSMASSTSHDSELGSTLGDRNSPLLAPDHTKSQTKSSPLPRRKGLARLSLKQKSSGSSQSLVQGSPTSGHRRFALRVSSSAGRTRGGAREGEETGGRGSSGGLTRTDGSQFSLESQPSDEDMGRGVRVEEGEVYEVDMVTRQVTLHRDCHIFDLSPPTSSGRDRLPGGEGEARGKPSSSENQSQTQQSSPSTSQLRQKKVPGKSVVDPSTTLVGIFV